MSSRTASAQAKAAVLVQALPWLGRFRGRTVVVKFGGNAMTDTALQAAFAEDVVFLRYAGLRPVVVHTFCSVVPAAFVAFSALRKSTYSLLAVWYHSVAVADCVPFGSR